MEIHLNQDEEDALKRYAKDNKITFGEAWQMVIDAMKDGLMKLAIADDERIENETQVETDTRNT